jgi:hypothetical protein
LNCFVWTLFMPGSGFSMAFKFQGQNSRNRKWRLSLSNPWACRHCWDQLWSLLGNLSRNSEHAPELDTWSEAAAWRRASWAMREGYNKTL